MKSENLPKIIYCNNADTLKYKKYSAYHSLHLEYRENTQLAQNVRIKLPEFICPVNYLPPRILDLMEIAGYVFAADRLLKRGKINAREFHAWERMEVTANGGFQAAKAQC